MDNREQEQADQPQFESQTELKLFELYHFGKMTEADRAEFEERLQKESAFKYRFDRYLASIGVINVPGLRKDIERILKKGARPKRVRSVFFCLLIVMSVAVIIAIYYFLSSRPNSGV